ncbi:MAG TPA: ion channel, partial [Thermoanaerobaculia bacterium]
ACGPQALSGVTAADGPSFWRSFFFSVQTFATIGYGHLSPSGMPANVLVTLESLVGLLGFALATGILFARFSRPTAKILFSRQALIAPYQGITAFELRIANARSNQLTEVQARLLLSKLPPGRTSGSREFSQLALERNEVAFFPLSWTIVHPIDEASPLWGMTEETLAASEAEFYVLLSAYDETFAQTVRSRTSYKHDEIVWNARFASLFNPPREDGLLSINVGRLNDYERLAEGPLLHDAAAPVERTKSGGDAEGEEMAS